METNAIPTLLDLIQARDSALKLNLIARAADALRAFGTTGKQVVPALLGRPSPPKEGVKDPASNALWAIDPEAADQAGVE